MTADPSTSSTDVTVVVLAGGTSRRFGSDKLAAPLHGSTVLETVVGSLPPGWPSGCRGAATRRRPGGDVGP